MTSCYLLATQLTAPTPTLKPLKIHWEKRQRDRKEGIQGGDTKPAYIGSGEKGGTKPAYIGSGEKQKIKVKKSVKERLSTVKVKYSINQSTDKWEKIDSQDTKKGKSNK